MNPAASTPIARIDNAMAAVAGRLAVPPTPPDRPGQAQSLADGAAGVALLHIERALTGTGTWNTAHDWLRAAAHGGVLADVGSSLFRGAPALAFALHAATTDKPGRYDKAQPALHRAVTALAHRRTDHALVRITRAELPRMAEYDVISGLTGIGAHLLRHAPDDDALGRILTYLVRLTEPLHHHGEVVPGWWTEQDPHARNSPAFPGGHANLGLAHGITGPLALLALAKLRGTIVPGHLDAIERINTWLDRWRQHDNNGTWWPQWITHQDHRTGRPGQPGPLRPSWCYGTPGLARAQQLAGLALNDPDRRRLAENALAACLTQPDQLQRLSDTSLCHGWAGLTLTAWRTAADAADPMISTLLPAVIDQLLHHATTTADSGDGFLEGRAGVALVMCAIAQDAPPTSGWDACLLIT
ncbi:lanthionine synthetase [Micromonospora fluostatini]|uniref:Lanthionine synthetase n=1 Tax=Micromonospora fluostatini TaxID=1629071 RepID=A0ABY2DLP0_9ACTN|nr:lanthionine synthetase [Micromonospora fluostatini]